MQPTTRGSTPPQQKSHQATGLYRAASLAMAFTFAAVGLVFLLAPNAALELFNGLSPLFGLPVSDPDGPSFYLILAAGYMYAVSVAAFLMYRHPESDHPRQMLIHAKAASSILSLWLYWTHQPYLIYIANAVVDGAIAVGVLLLGRANRGS